MNKELITKLAVIQQKLKCNKTQRNCFGNYNYRNCEDILEAVKPLLGFAVILLSDEIVFIGDRYYVKATATFTDGLDQISVTAYARESLDKKGMDVSQISGSSSSYARKYALNGLLTIDDNKDADYSNDAPKSIKDDPDALEMAKRGRDRLISDLQDLEEDPSKIAELDDVRTAGVSELRKRITDMLLLMNDGDIEESKKHLEEISSFTGAQGNVVPGTTATNKLTGKWLYTTYGKVKKLAQDWREAHPEIPK